MLVVGDGAAPATDDAGDHDEEPRAILSPLRAALAAGAIAGVAALLLFVALHALFLIAIPGMLVAAPVVAVLGLPVGWAFDELVRHGALRGRGRGLAFGLLVFLTLAPVFAVSAIAAPEGRTDFDMRTVAPQLFIAAPAGAIVAWLLTRRVRPSLAFAAAALALGLSLGHNVPFFPLGDAATYRMLALIGVVELFAGAVLDLAYRGLGPPA